MAPDRLQPRRCPGAEEHGGCEDAAVVPNCTILRVALADSDGGEDFVVAGIDRLGTAAGLA